MPATVIVVTGVSGAGKSTVAAAVAEQLGWDRLEGDELHSVEAVTRMTAGVPLTDADRLPWLRRIRTWIDEHLDHDRCAVVACSALRRAYRDELRRDGVFFVQLTVPEDLARLRLERRHGHFMPASLLPSQLELLEPLGPDESGATVATHAPPAEVVTAVVAAAVPLPL